ncbi:MAG: DEAD/DEAH box helicase [Balneolaceae bacterium]|nr:DEAD/DEAH box helicase [Balneolaceae bacterium]
MKDVKIESPSPLQKKIFKAVQEKKDLVINTTIEDKPEVGYLISLLNEISQSERRQGTRAIILAGDKERAKHLDEWIWAIGYHSSIESACFTEDGNEKEQKTALSAGPVVIVATPSRLAHLLEENRMIFREVQQMIVDQAEMISDWQQVEVISKRVIGKCQRIFTAAKDSKELRDAEKQILQDPALVTLAKKPKQESKPAEKQAPKSEEKIPEVSKNLTQYYINVPPRSKITTLLAHLDNTKTDAVVIFTASTKTADRLYKILRKNNKRAVSLHEKLDEKTFTERFERFTSGNVQHLLAGDLSAAKLPLEKATQVINYDVPEDVNEYKLRADLVGDGKATRITSLVSKQDRNDINTICDSLGYAPEELPLPTTVKEKITSNDNKPKKGSGKKGKRNTSRSNKRSKPGKPKRGKSNQKLKELPRPTFDQLEGGRTGKKKKKGLFGFIKNLFE